MRSRVDWNAYCKLFFIGYAALHGGLCFGVFGVGLPDLQCAFDVDLVDVSSIFLCYGCPATIGALVSIPLLERFDTHLLLTTSMSFYCVAMTAVVVSPHLHVAQAVLVVMGLSSGVLGSVTGYAVSHLFPESQYVFQWVSATSAAGSLLSPILAEPFLGKPTAGAIARTSHFSSTFELVDRKSPTGLFNATWTSLLNATRTSLLNATGTSLFNATRASLLNAARTINATRTNLFKATRTSLLNTTGTSLLNATRISLLNAIRANLLNATRISLLNATRTSLLNATRTSLLNATRHANETNEQHSYCEDTESNIMFLYVTLGILGAPVVIVFGLYYATGSRINPKRPANQTKSSATSRETVFILLVMMAVPLSFGMSFAYASYLTTIAVHDGYGIQSMVLLTSLFWLVMFFSRVFFMAISFRFKCQMVILWISVVLSLIGMVVASLSSVLGSVWLWTGSLILAFGIGPQFGNLVDWTRSHVYFTPLVAGILCVSDYAGSTFLPYVSGLFVSAYGSSSLNYYCLALTVYQLIVFSVLTWIGRSLDLKKNIRYTKLVTNTDE